jgi:hypothetical protein
MKRSGSQQTAPCATHEISSVKTEDKSSGQPFDVEISALVLHIVTEMKTDRQKTLT